MTARRKKIVKIALVFIILFVPILSYLLWPIRTDNTIAPPDPVLLPGKQSYLTETKASTLAPPRRRSWTTN